MLIKSKPVLSVVLTGCLLTGFSGVSHAVEPDGSVEEHVIEAVKAIAEVDVALVEDAADLHASENGGSAVEVTIENVDITVPVDPSEQLTIGSEEGVIGVTLPFSGVASDAVAVEGGVVAYDNNNGSVTVPIVREDGTLQMNTVISSPEAPRAYPYTFELPAGAMIKEDRGGLLFLDDDQLVGALAPAWAKDADGRDVPTRFIASGSTVTQIVEHGEHHSYPVVADPWLGKALYSRVYVSTTSKGWVVNATLSTWGKLWTGLVVYGAHKDEVKSKIASSRWNASIEQQLYCHLLGFPLSLPEFNLESWRPKVAYATSLVKHKCNP